MLWYGKVLLVAAVVCLQSAQGHEVQFIGYMFINLTAVHNYWCGLGTARDVFVTITPDVCRVSRVTVATSQ